MRKQNFIDFYAKQREIPVYLTTHNFWAVLKLGDNETLFSKDFQLFSKFLKSLYINFI